MVHAEGETFSVRRYHARMIMTALGQFYTMIAAMLTRLLLTEYQPSDVLINDNRLEDGVGLEC